MTKACGHGPSAGRLGDVHHSAGDIPAARRTWARALRVFDEIRHQGSERIRLRLQAPGRPAGDLAAAAAR